MSNSILTYLGTLASLFSVVIVLMTDTIESEVKVYAILAITVLVLVVNRNWLVKKISTGSILKKGPVGFLIAAFLIVLLSVLTFFRVLVKVDPEFVTNEQYWEVENQKCPNDYGDLASNPVVDITAECAGDYLESKSNWCCTFGLPSQEEVEFNPGGVSESPGCSSIAEFVTVNSDKDGMNLGLLQDNSIIPVRDDVADQCTSFRLKSSCSVLCTVFDLQ